MLFGYIPSCASYAGGEHIFRKTMNKWPESEKGSQNNVGYIKIPPKWYWKHQDVIKIMSDTRLKSPKEAPVAIIHIFATLFEVQLGRHRGDKRGKERTTER